MGQEDSGAQQGLSEEQIRELLANEIAVTLGGLLGALGPEPPISQERFDSLLAAMVEEQLQVQKQVLPAFLGAAREERPRFMVEVRAPNGATGYFEASKTLDTTDPGKCICTVMALTLLFNAGARGLLRANGVQYRFIDVKEPSKILVPR